MYTPRLLLLSFLLWSRSEADVLETVWDCAEFFLNGEPPEIPGVLENGQILDHNRFKAICQTFKNKPRFFTLYDATNKSPVFSAYIFKGSESGTKRQLNAKWREEPQLDQDQARVSDYPTHSGYDRGHLYPCSHAYSQDDKDSTFALTNAVPQDPSFNRGSLRRMEHYVKRFMEKHCIDNNNQIKAFVVTGAVPGDELLNNMINIPSMMWLAFCCYDKTAGMWHAGAHWGDNVPETRGKCMETMTLEELYSKLTFKLFFDDNCPSDVRVDLYPKGKSNQMCNVENTDSKYATSTQSTPTTTTTVSKKTTSSQGTENLGNQILNASRNCCGAIASGLSWLFGAIVSGLRWIFGAIVSGLSWIFGAIVSGLSWIFGAIVSGLSWIFGAIVSGLRWIFKEIALVLVVCLFVGVLYGPHMEFFRRRTEICPLHLTHPLRQ